MGRYSIKVKDDIDRQFRQAVFQRKGMKKGNITQALEEAMIMWANVPTDKIESKLNKEKEA